jgi:hypothetical protein
MNMTTNHLAALVLAISCFSAPIDAMARVANSTLDGLLKDTQLVVEVSPRRIERRGASGGEAVVSVQRVIFGELADKELTLPWSEEEHDLPIHDLGSDWLLFLKKDSAGKWVAARYGTGFVPIWGRAADAARADLDRRSILPIMWKGTLVLPGRIELTPAEAKRLVSGSQITESGAKVPMISMKLLRELILEKKGAGH